MLFNMLTNTNKTSKYRNSTSERFETSKSCKVSKASNEIMLDRFYNVKGIEFPFS